MPVIYADGDTEEVTESEGEILRAAGLVQPVTDEDYKLSATAGWSAVRRVLDRLRV